MRKNEIHAFLEDCEDDLRGGRAQKLESRLGALDLSRLSREALLPLARVARRAGRFIVGLKLLSRAMRSMNEPPSAQEMAEYAVLLQKIGAVEEAASLLGRVDKHEVPVARLYQAFQHFHEWDAAAAIPYLEWYLKAEISDYDRAVGRVNLAAAYLQADQPERADALLREYIDANRNLGFVRLEGNCRELRAQLLIQRRDFREADAELKQADALFQNEATPDAFFVHKWRYILEALETRRTEPLLQLRSEAAARREWETVRDSDLFLAQVDFTPGRFEHLYFGTPFPAYRRRILRVLDTPAPDPDSVYEYGNDGPCFDLEHGRLDASPADAKELIDPGSKLHQLLTLLLLDLYRPLRAAGLFAALFPEERFDPFTSMDRVHRLIARARSALRSATLPLEIVHRHDGFCVDLSGPLRVRLRADRGLVDRNKVFLDMLKAAFPDREFTSREGAEICDLSMSAFKRLAAWAIERGKMEKVGAGKSTIYQLCTH